MNGFSNRQQAGQILANSLTAYANRKDVIVLGLARGGVPVAYEVAKALKLPLDVFIVRKLGVPDQEEFAFGAIAMGGIVVFNHDVMQELYLSERDINQVIDKETQELARREKLYLGDRPHPIITDKTVILIDDGIATGATMKAAILALKQQKPAAIILAVPVAASSTCQELASLVDQLICPLQPTFFNAVGSWYDDFSQTTDEEVHRYLNTKLS